MKKITLRQSGFTLLEMIFALGFLMMTIAAILALTVANIAGEAESENQVIANNLARESIEVVRNIRDGNWLAKVPFDNAPIAVGTDKSRTIFDPAANSWTIDTPAQASASFELYRSADGIYSYNNTNNTKTMFSRHIFIYYICRAPVSGAEAITYPCNFGFSAVGLRVRAVVSWNEQGRRRQVMLEDFLYDWK